MSDAEPGRAVTARPPLSTDEQLRLFARMLTDMVDRLHHQDHRIAELMRRVAAVEQVHGE
jgi:hypothetical protein